MLLITFWNVQKTAKRLKGRVDATYYTNLNILVCFVFSRVSAINGNTQLVDSSWTIYSSIAYTYSLSACQSVTIYLSLWTRIDAPVPLGRHRKQTTSRDKTTCWTLQIVADVTRGNPSSSMGNRSTHKSPEHRISLYLYILLGKCRLYLI